MKKSELINYLHKIYPFFDTEQITNLIDIIFREITTSLKNDKRVELRDFGVFSAKKRKVQSKFRSNIQDPVNFEEKKAVHFKIGKGFFDRLNK